MQFSSRVAFKLVWVPPNFEEFLLVDDEGRLLKRGAPTGKLPSLGARQRNFALVQGGKYATAAEAIARGKETEYSPAVLDTAQVCNDTLNVSEQLPGA